VDDARKESKFAIKEMTLRSEWELIQKHIEDQLNKHIDDQLNDPQHRAVDSSITMRSQE